MVRKNVRIYKDPKSPYYFMDYTDSRGVRHRDSTERTREREAQDYANAFVSRILIRKGIKDLRNNLDETMTMFILYGLRCEELDKSDSPANVVHESKRRLKLFVDYIGDNFNVIDLEHDHLENYIKDRRKKVSPTSITGEISQLQAAINEQVKKKHLSRNPVRDFQHRLRGVKITKDTLLTPDEITAVMTALDLSNPIDRLIFISAHIGMRLGDILKRTWGDIDGISRITISKTQQPHGIYLPPSSIARLTSHKPPGSTNSDRVIVLPSRKHAHSKKGQALPKELSLSGYSQAVTRRIEGIVHREGLGTNCIRRSITTHLLNEGKSAKEVQGLMGWKTLAMVMHYAKSSTQGRKDLVDSMPWLNGDGK